MIGQIFSYIKSFFGADKKQIIENPSTEESMPKEPIKRNPNEFIKTKTQSMIDTQALNGYLSSSNPKVITEKVYAQRGQRHH